MIDATNDRSGALAPQKSSLPTEERSDAFEVAAKAFPIMPRHARRRVVRLETKVAAVATLIAVTLILGSMGRVVQEWYVRKSESEKRQRITAQEAQTSKMISATSSR